MRSGFVLIDKPRGWTSHDVVAWTRARLGTKRVGHAGTLDPLATGLLPCLVGPGTRLARFLHDWPKTYVGVIALGLETPTDDAESLGDRSRPTVPLPPPEVLEAARRRLSGPQMQVPPAFSAKKIRGERAHRLARRGRSAAPPPVRVIVHKLRLQALPAARLAFAARVSAGTYLRSLARDLGRIVGTGAYLERLRRTGIGPLRVGGATRPRPRGQAQPEAQLLALEALPLPFASIALEGDALRLFRHGVALELPLGSEIGLRRILDGFGRLAGVAEATAEGGEARLRPRIVLPEGAPEGS
jgi:tRNA pseudouridine55 synthase